MDKNNYIWPITPRYKVCKHDLYGIRENHYVLFKKRGHAGLDITIEPETEIKSATNGIVAKSEFDGTTIEGFNAWNDGYGNKIEIINDCDNRRLIYAHLRKSFVKPGDKIKQGQIIGLTGCSGGSRVPHLHFEIRKNDTEAEGIDNTVNPLDLLPKINLNKIVNEFKLEPYRKLWEIMASDKPWSFTEKDIPYKDDKDIIY